MKHKGLQRAFAFALTLLLTLGSLGGFGLERSAKAEVDPGVTVTITPSATPLFIGDAGVTLTAAITGLGDRTVTNHAWSFKTGSTGAFQPISASTGATHTFGSALSTSFNGYVYQCEVTLSDGRTQSGVYTLSVNKKLTKIEVSTPPTKTTYTAGERFDSAGMAVTATYNDTPPTTADVTGYTVDPSGALATSHTKVTVSYLENGVTRTAEQAITVNAAPTPAFVAATDIAMTSTNTVAAGGEITLAATVAPENATNQEITWALKSAGTAIGSAVDPATGKFTAGGTEGTATVTATIANGATESTDFTKDFTITVSAAFIPVTSITGVPTTAVVGTDLTLTGTVLPSDATNKNINDWSIDSSNTLNGASIANGKLVTTTAGTAKVKATIPNGLGTGSDYTQVFSITVAAAAPTIAISGQPTSSTTVVEGNISGSLTCVATVSNGATPAYQWYSHTEKSTTGGTAVAGATASSFAIPTGLTNAGSPYYYYCKVSAAGAADTFSNVATVTVSGTGSTVTGVTVSPATASLARGSTTQEFRAAVTGANTPSQNVTWELATATQTSSGTQLYVRADGSARLEIGMDEPNTTLTVRAKSEQDPSKSGTATVTVTGPYIVINSTTPGDVTVVKGNSVKLTCTATVTPAGTAPTYAWYVKSGSAWTPIAGANGKDYTITTTNLAVGTYQYFCRVSAGSTTLDSRQATVTVNNAPTYQVTSGGGSTFTQGSGGTLKFTVNAAANLFDRVVVDNVTLTQGTHYQIASGSTIVTLLNSFLKTLSVGTHTLYVWFSDGGYAMVTFVVSGQPYVWNLYANITQGNHVETTWLGKGEKMRLTLWVNNPSSTYVKWHFSSRRIGLSSTSTQLYYDNNTGYYVTWIDVTPRYNGNVWVYAENSGRATDKHHFTVVGMNNLPATGQDSRPIYILLGVSALTAAALGAMYVYKRRKAL